MPTDEPASVEAIEMARKVLGAEVPSPISERCYYTKYNPKESIFETVNAFASPIQIIEKGNIFHYDVTKIDTEKVD